MIANILEMKTYQIKIANGLCEFDPQLKRDFCRETEKFQDEFVKNKDLLTFSSFVKLLCKTFNEYKIKIDTSEVGWLGSTSEIVDDVPMLKYNGFLTMDFEE